TRLAVVGHANRPVGGRPLVVPLGVIVDAVVDGAFQPSSPIEPTVSRSSTSSATVASIRDPENGSMSRSCTIEYTPPLVVTGNEEIKPTGTPYDPSDGMAMLTQSPFAVPVSHVRTW